MGVPESSLQKGAHWRKPWPYGIDNGDDDEGVVSAGGQPGCSGQAGGGAGALQDRVHGAQPLPVKGRASSFSETPSVWDSFLCTLSGLFDWFVT